MKTQLTLATITLLSLGCANSTTTNTAAAPMQEEAPPIEAAPAKETKTAAPVKGNHPSPGKTSAPVSISLKAVDGATLVHVQPGANGTDIAITLKGIDGLELGAEDATRRIPALTSGEGLDLRVSPKGDSPRGTLVVTVEGNFDGVNRGKVKSFPIGGPKVQEETGAVETGLGPVMPAGGE